MIEALNVETSGFLDYVTADIGMSRPELQAKE
jgi:hypothetical protein